MRLSGCRVGVKHCISCLPEGKKGVITARRPPLVLPPLIRPLFWPVLAASYAPTWHLFASEWLQIFAHRGSLWFSLCLVLIFVVVGVFFQLDTHRCCEMDYSQRQWVHFIASSCSLLPSPFPLYLSSLNGARRGENRTLIRSTGSPPVSLLTLITQRAPKGTSVMGCLSVCRVWKGDCWYVVTHLCLLWLIVRPLLWNPSRSVRFQPPCVCWMRRVDNIHWGFH